MKKFKCLLVSFMITFAVFVAAPSVLAVDESVEPADTYKLALNDTEVEIFTDKDIELSENAGKAKVRLIVNPEKRFTYGDVDFQYPRYFTFEADLNVFDRVLAGSILGVRGEARRCEGQEKEKNMIRSHSGLI